MFLSLALGEEVGCPVHRNLDEPSGLNLAQDVVPVGPYHGASAVAAGESSKNMKHFIILLFFYSN